MLSKLNLENFMKTIIALIIALGTASLVAFAFAHDDAAVAKTTIANQQTAKYAIENMTCKMCDITIRKSMEKVDGVIEATVDYDTKTATVVFNPAKTNIKSIGMASTNAGYKATSI